MKRLLPEEKSNEAVKLTKDSSYICERYRLKELQTKTSV